MGTETKSRDEAGSGSIPNKSSAAKEGITPKLDAQQELGDKGREARSTSDRPRLLRRLRVATIMVAILAVVGMGTAAALVSKS